MIGRLIFDGDTQCMSPQRLAHCTRITKKKAKLAAATHDCRGGGAIFWQVAEEEIGNARDDFDPRSCLPELFTKFPPQQMSLGVTR